MSAPVEAYHTATIDRKDYETPERIFAPLHEEFGFTVDVCAHELNHKMPRYFTPEMDGLAQDWTGERCWMNPPYGKDIVAWVKKARESALAGALVVGLLPARTDSGWWHNHVVPAAEIRFLRGRIKFVGMPYSAPFPCAVVVWRPE